MTARNERHHTTILLSDFDAVSLYPSAMRQLWTVLGTPQIIPPEHLSLKFLLEHSFTEDQLDPTFKRFISAYVVEIEILSIAKHRDFPLIRVQSDNKINYANELTRVIVDQIALEDLIIPRHYL